MRSTFNDQAPISILRQNHDFVIVSKQIQCFFLILLASKPLIAIHSFLLYNLYSIHISLLSCYELKEK